jgi:hypothetical protein
MATMVMNHIESEIILRPSAQAASSPSVFIFFENVVTKAVESAPSANRVAQHVWRAEGGGEDAGEGGTEEAVQHLIAHESEDAAAEDGDGDDPGGPCLRGGVFLFVAHDA